MPIHVVSSGDCVLSIADQYGLFWQTIWDHAENADLKHRRPDPNVLAPGDEVFVPEKRIKTVNKPTDKIHTFVRKGTPAKVRLQLLDFERRPRRDLPYTVDVDGVTTNGKTDAEGMVEVYAPLGARSAKLIVNGPRGNEEYQMDLGHIDPVELDEGVRQRLENLGFHCDGNEMSEAVRAFQKEKGIPETGEADDNTRSKLKEAHGC